MRKRKAKKQSKNIGNDIQAETNDEQSKPKPSFKVEQLEPRILLSATWTDADTGEAQDGPTDGNDSFDGSDANEYIRASDGDDILSGNGGNDTLFGGDGDDTVSGGDGNDRLFGGSGADHLSGGAGNDVIYADGDDTVDGGEGYDYLRADSGSDGPSHVDMAASNIENVDLHNTSGDKTIDASNSDSNVWARGGSGDDTITGGSGNDYLYGHGGDDVVIGDGERIELGDLRGSVTASDQQTGTGYIMYTDESVHDRFSDDPVHGRNADHFVTVKYIDGEWYYDNNSAHRAGSDPMDAMVKFEPRDTDLIIAEVDFDSDELKDLRGTAGNVAGIESGYAGGDLDFTVDSHEGKHNPGEFELSGEFFVRNSSGEGSNDRILGGEGADHLIGGSGNDVIYADSDDRVDGGTGYDYLRADSGSDGPSHVDMAASSIENVDLHNTSGDKNIDASNSDSNVWARGGSGNDTIRGGAGDDALFGHDGDDHIQGDGGPNLVTNGSFDVSLGTTPTDSWTVNVANQVELDDQAGDGLGVNVNVEPENANLDVSISQQIDGVEDGTSYELSFDVGDRALLGDGGVEVFWNGERIATIDAAEAGNDRLAFEIVGGSGDGSNTLEFKGFADVDKVGTVVDNVSIIEGSNDRIFGGAGADTLRGGGGNDVIYADSDDTVDGGSGYDYLRADSGSDGPSNVDMGASNIENVDLHNTTGNKNINASSSDGNVWARGGSGDDTISGGAGDDALYGHDGDDVIEGDNGPNLITNGSFEDLDGTTKTGWGHRTTETSGWTLDDGRVLEIVDSGHGGVQSSDGDHWLDLDESPGNVGISQQVQGVEDGQAYELSFDVANRAAQGSGGVEVYWNGELVATIEAESRDMESHAFEVIGGSGDGSNTLSFKGIGAEDNVGASLDNVSLVKGGNDRIFGGAGADTLRGGGGNDVIYADSDDTVDGGTGYDYLRADSGSDGPSNVDMAASNIENVDLHNTTGDKNIDASNSDENVWARGGSGDDRVTGGSGDDRLYGHDGDDVVSGGDGNDRIFGGKGADTLSGGAGNDVIYADGDDTVDGGEGYDYLRADSGSDGPSNVDMAASNIENVDLHNTTGAKNIDASNSDTNVWARGGSGNDTVTGGSGNDALYGHDGDDVVSGGEGNDRLYGGTGNDTLRGGDGNDYLFGQDGDDRLEGGAGNDRIYGGEGNDTVVFDGARSDYEVTENANGSFTIRDMRPGGGTDYAYDVENFEFSDGTVDKEGLFNQAPTDIELDARSVAENAAPGTVVATASVSDPDANDTFSFNLTNDADGRFTVDDNGVIQVAEGADLNHEAADSHEITLEVTDAQGATYTETFQIGVDNVNEAPTSVALDGATVAENAPGAVIGALSVTDVDAGDSHSYSVSDDRFEVQDGKLKLKDGMQLNFEAESSVELTVTVTDAGGAEHSQNFEITVEDRVDQVRGTGGDDVLSGDSGDDRIRAGAGDDVVQAGAGDDNVAGGRGDDDIFGNDGNDNLRGNAGDDVVDGGAGNDRVSGGRGDDQLSGGDGDDVISGGSGKDRIDGGAGQDRIHAGNDDDVVNAGDGDDRVNAGGGDDLVDAGSGNDRVNAGGGDDVVSGGAGNDNIAGGAGNDTITGDDGDDNLRGNAGDDVISGGAGDDRVVGGSGDDQLSGGDGNDIINGGSGKDRIDGGAGNDRINSGNDDDIVNAGEGNDRVNSGSGNDQVDAGAGNDRVNAGGGDDVVNAGDGDDRVSGGKGNDTISGGAGDDNLRGNQGDDVIDGGAGDDRVIGGSGNDELSGGEGDDIINSGSGNDRVDGGAGDDRINAGGGDDIVSGGEGNDRINAGGGDDIVDAGAGNDRVGGGSGDDTINAGEGDDFVAGGKGDDKIMGDAGNDDLRGNAGDDVIDGGSGDDRLLGGSGDDRLIGGAGDDFIHGGSGDDTVVLTGDWTDYTITKNPDGSVTIVDNRDGSPDGTDRVKNVDNFEFTDGTRTYDELFNVAPEDIEMTGGTVAENAPAGTVVGALVAVDANVGDAAQFEITGGAADLFELDGNEIKLREGVQLDFEAASQHELEVTATDVNGESFTKTVTINVGNVNEAIDSVALDASVVAENAAGGTVVGTVNVSDPDAGDTHSFTMMNDADGRFTIDAETGVISVTDNADLNFEAASQHEVTVKVVDAGGNEKFETFTINVGDVNEAPTDFIFTEPVTVNETMANGSEITRITGIDQDANETFLFEMMNDGNGAFAVDAESGVVSVADASKLGDMAGQDMTLVVKMTDSAGNEKMVEVNVPVEKVELESAPKDNTEPQQRNDNASPRSDEPSFTPLQPDSSGNTPQGDSEVDFGLEAANENQPGSDADANDRSRDDAPRSTQPQREVETARDVDLAANDQSPVDVPASNVDQSQPAAATLDVEFRGQTDAQTRENAFNYINNRDRQDRADGGAADGVRDVDRSGVARNGREFVGQGGLPKLDDLGNQAPASFAQAGIDAATTNSGNVDNDRLAERELANADKQEANNRDRNREDTEPVDFGLGVGGSDAEDSAFVADAADELAEKPTGFMAGLWALLRGKAGLGKTEDELLAQNQKRESARRK